MGKEPQTDIWAWKLLELRVRDECRRDHELIEKVLCVHTSLAGWWSWAQNFKRLTRSSSNKYCGFFLQLILPQCHCFCSSAICAITENKLICHCQEMCKIHSRSDAFPCFSWSHGYKSWAKCRKMHVYHPPIYHHWTRLQKKSMKLYAIEIVRNKKRPGGQISPYNLIFLGGLFLCLLTSWWKL